MLLYANIALNLVALALTVLILCTYRRNLWDAAFDKVCFLALVMSVLVGAALDTVSWLLDKSVFGGSVVLSYLVNSLLFSVPTIACALWLTYLDCVIFQDARRTRTRMMFYFAPALVNAAVSLLNLLTDVYFTVTSDNVYIRLAPAVVPVALSFGYLLYSVVMVVRARGRIMQHNFRPLLLLCFPIIIGVTLQMLFFGISLMWISVAMSLLILFITYQNDIAVTDRLTGLCTGRYLTETLETMLRQKDAPRPLCILMDVETYPSVAATAGRRAADELLVVMAGLMKKCAKRGDVLAYMGGARFAAVTCEQDASLLDRVTAAVARYNGSATPASRLSFASGSARAQKNADTCADDLLDLADARLYQENNLRMLRKQAVDGAAPPPA